MRGTDLLVMGANRWRTIAAGLLPFVGLLWLAKTFWGAPGKADFYFHQAQYKKIIQLVKASNMKMNSEMNWVVSSWTQRLALSKRKSGVWPSALEGEVAARRAGNGYIVSIVTCDKGHLGTYGYVYSDFAMAPLQNDDYSNFNGPGDLRFLNQRVNTHGGPLITICIELRKESVVEVAPASVPALGW